MSAVHSGQQQLAKTVHAALLAAPALAPLVSINRRRPLDRELSSGLFITLDASRAERVVIGASDWRTRLVVECVARAAPDQDPAEAVDALLQGVYQRVMAIGQTEQPGLIDISYTPEEISWDYDDVDLAVVVCRITFEAQHRTHTRSLAPWGTQ